MRPATRAATIRASPRSGNSLSGNGAGRMPRSPENGPWKPATKPARQIAPTAATPPAVQRSQRDCAISARYTTVAKPSDAVPAREWAMTPVVQIASVIEPSSTAYLAHVGRRFRVESIQRAHAAGSVSKRALARWLL